MKNKHIMVILVSLIVMMFHAGQAMGDPPYSILNDINEIISQGESVPFIRLENLKNKIGKNPENILPVLLAKAYTPELPETDLAIYIWAIGLTRSPKAIDDIIKLSSGNQSELVTGNACKALALIGGEKAGQYLFKKLHETSDQMIRYNLLDLLAQIQYVPALPKTIEILRQDPQIYYWQNIFVFGKYGDLAIPFLLEKINDKNKNIRTNSIMVLSQWLIATKAVTRFKELFWEENDPRIRVLLLSALEKINADFEDVKAFSQKVLKKEKDANVARFAKETVDDSGKRTSHLDSFKSQKKRDRAACEEEYNKILNSLGKEGDYNKLAATSTKEDEQKLKRLKEVILQRNSDECFYDYQKVNNIITLNRLIYKGDS